MIFGRKEFKRDRKAAEQSFAPYNERLLELTNEYDDEMGAYREAIKNGEDERARRLKASADSLKEEIAALSDGYTKAYGRVDTNSKIAKNDADKINNGLLTGASIGTAVMSMYLGKKALDNSIVCDKEGLMKNKSVWSFLSSLNPIKLGKK